MDSLFQSFNQQVSMNNFAELSGCVFSWIEEQCKPGDLQVTHCQGEANCILFISVTRFFCLSSLPSFWYTQLMDEGNLLKKKKCKTLETIEACALSGSRRNISYLNAKIRKMSNFNPNNSNEQGINENVSRSTFLIKLLSSIWDPESAQTLHKSLK